MPIIKSAKKRVKTAAKATARNAKTRRNLREAIKDFKVAVAGGKSEAIAISYREAVSAIDIAAKKNVIHKNKAARKKHQLAVELKAKGVKLTASKKSVKSAKSVTKKIAAKPKSTKKTSPIKKPTEPTLKKTIKKPLKKSAK
jgi:small subunit ribosomal protein S20